MVWFKVDDGFHGHPKVVELDLPAVGLWTIAGSWCAKYLTDGAITLRTVLRLGGTEALAEALIESGLWEPLGEAEYQFKDWDDYQPLKSAIESERDAARLRMANVRAKRKGTQDSGASKPAGNESGSSAEQVGERSGEHESHEEGSTPEVRSAPAQPSPAQPESSKEDFKPPTRAKRGTRVDEDWIPSEATRATIRAEYPNLDLGKEHRVFIDYWVAKAGKDAVKLDWDATWRNWMRRKGDDGGSAPARRSPAPSKPSPTDRALATKQLAANMAAGGTKAVAS